jgi:outer membrane protein assembly factor BamB
MGGQVMSSWGFAESVLIDGDHLICTPGGSRGTLAALDKMTGKVLWRTAKLTDRAAYCSLVPAEIGGVHQYVVMTDQHVAGIAADGKVLWQASRPGGTAVICTPVVHDNLVFVTSAYSVGCNCFKVTAANGQFKAEQIYAYPKLAVHNGGVVRVGDYLYGALEGAELACIEMKTGKVIWKNKSIWSDGKYGDKGSLTYADGNLYLRGEGKLNAAPSAVALIEATPDGYHELGRFEQPDRSDQLSWSHPVVAGGKLYLRDQDVLLCYDIKAK